ncbi:MAG TPA: methylthioribulose 1-phosphate dehydratase [Pyrinomonadaceae bacterium]|nr:methylthioribulose 1-phosphate dehydratase [Pyrinomonadaceae bacterium]
MSENVAEIVDGLVLVGRNFYARGWLMGTSGNLSAVVEREPLRLAITASGVDKGELKSEQVLLVDDELRILSGARNAPGFTSGPESINKASKNKPSDESLLHVRIVKERGAGAVLHTHSIWNTIHSDLHASEGGVRIEGYEMLKGLAGVRTHDHSEWLPIVENSQDMPALADTISKTLRENKSAHGFLIRRHGLYTWGEDLTQAKRHVEILEFLLETMGRTAMLKKG